MATQIIKLALANRLTKVGDSRGRRPPVQPSNRSSWQPSNRATTTPHGRRYFCLTPGMRPRINPFTVPHHFRGLGWYRKGFVAPASWRGCRVWLEFKGVFQVADVWINGHHLGRHVGGFTEFQFDLTDNLKWGDGNLIAVRVNDVLSPEIAPANETNVPGYGGIYRSVSLLVTDPIYITANGTSIGTQQSGESVAVSVRSWLRNSGQIPSSVRLHLVIRDAQGQTVSTIDSDTSLARGQERSIEQTFRVPSPHLWSPDSPYLYNLTSALFVGDRAVDREDNSFGGSSVESCG